MRVLTFDIENRPLSYWIPDRPTAEVTAIAWSFDDPDKVSSVLLGRETLPEMLGAFLAAYNEADMVVGHYIRKHDLPLLNGALIEQRMPTLSAKLVLDTKIDMIRKTDIPATQENLSEMLGVEAPKVHMTQAMWRESNRLTKKGLGYTKKRAEGDVLQNMLLRRAMVAAGWLKAPRVWRP
jgi:hypothetical protein